MRLSRPDPLILFLVAGLAIYGLHALLAPERETVRVGPEVVDALVEDYRLLEGRAPDAAAREALIERWVTDEILFREALERGLHLGDPTIRHRLADKLRFLLTDLPPEPTEAELRSHYVEHADRLLTDHRITFEQRFFPPDVPIPDDAGARLAAGEEIGTEAFWLGRDFDAYHAAMLRSIFGAPFVAALLEAPEDRWVGPLESGRGRHFVRVTAVAEPAPVPFAEARERVRGDWLQARREASVARRLAAIRDDYEVRLATDAASGTTPGAANRGPDDGSRDAADVPGRTP